jgi:Patatin-like phospholipase
MRHHENSSRNMQRLGTNLLWITIAVSIALEGCAGLPRQAAVPSPMTERARSPAAGDARFWPDLDQDREELIAGRAAERERVHLIGASAVAPDRLPPENYLAISSGGDNGAFAAGLLVGWTARGNRPAFDVVTGVSAGALVAPFAFLGCRYDEVLRAVSSRIRSRDIFNPRSLIAGLTSDGFVDDSPLVSTIDKYITQDVLREVARAYSEGRLLFVATTNLDARQPVVWDMGAIAARGDAAALDLFRKVILASTAIPGVFPPVMIDVEVDGKPYQEMHVDGAVMRQVFLFPLRVERVSSGQSRIDDRERHLYIIRNGRIDPQWGSTERRTTAVARRALDALVDREAVDDMYRIQSLARRDGADLNIAFIDSRFTYPHRRLFADDYMQHLFEYSYQLGASGYPWRKLLPDGGSPSPVTAISRQE